MKPYEYPTEYTDGILEEPSAWQGAIDIRRLEQLPASGTGTSAPVDFWFPFMVPSYNQSGPSCVGHSWANWIEAFLRFHVNPLSIPKGYQIDGEAIWRRGRQLFWGGNMGGGLYLSQGFHAAKDLGFLPSDAKLAKVGQDWDSVNNALQETPLVQGHIINKGWFKANTQSGCIDHEARPDRSGAHATLLMATLEQPDTAGNLTRWRVLLNSWGPDRGRFGFFTMSEETWLEQVMADGPYTAEIPDPYNWTGWKKGLVQK